MTLILAHRGYSALYPENTMTAFQAAEKAEADGLELDVQMSKDGELVVIHDEKVDRTTAGTGYIKDLTYNEIRKLDAGHKFNKWFQKNQIPSLTEVLEWLTTNQLICNIELKNGIFPYIGMEAKVIHLVRKYGLSNRIILSSFNHYSIVTCYRIAPEIETAPLLSECLYMPWVYAQSIQAKSIHPKYSPIIDEVIIQSMANGVPVRPYTINKETVMRRLFSIGCSAIITDDPVKAVKLRAQ